MATITTDHDLRDAVTLVLDEQEGTYDASAITRDLIDHHGGIPASLDDIDEDVFWATVLRHSDRSQLRPYVGMRVRTTTGLAPHLEDQPGTIVAIEPPTDVRISMVVIDLDTGDQVRLALPNHGGLPGQLDLLND